MYVFFKKTLTFLGACSINQTQPHLADEDKKSAIKEAKILSLQAKLTKWKKQLRQFLILNIIAEIRITSKVLKTIGFRQQPTAILNPVVVIYNETHFLFFGASL